MSSKSKRLGSLADVFQAEKLEGTIRKIRLDKIRPSESQPRQERKKGVEELAQSLDKDGLLQPILVTKKADEEYYTIIAGERRFHAATLLKWQEVECKILDKDAKETFRLAIIENLQRENLSPYEEIEAMTHLKSSFSYTDLELGNLFGKSRSYMTELLGISSLSKEDLKICRDAGIESKNLLVQAASAAKKGTLKDFLEKFNSGELKTVKDAKTFNRAEEGGLFSPSQISAKSGSEKSAASPYPYKIIKKGTSVIISTEDETFLAELHKFVKKEISKKFGK
ncbi:MULTISPECIES: ParB/RepB/Spo0J family partition protein [unclassified Leptospira]|uniref:ParB/RepB/Spo0J family partition protein n=1 Tax=unclassified Leptospira TaxID=2633828 RepID=UPI0002BDE50F|nr:MULTISPECIES: ParB/RepB/Spo0J family partition protein [unclassified Leptospira]EMJ99518.1 ParB-like protein [Leptospira sp. B5-022]MCR1792463.1 ParB/RepB/Spo0J family partition protein [Leptospira sp. id769339]